jgi:hypothetical protein
VDGESGINEPEPIDESELHRLMTESFGEAGATALFETLEERRVTRGRRLYQLYLRPPLWHALEDVLRALRMTTDFLDTSSLEELAAASVLAARVLGDTEEALDALLAGVRATVSDAMRDVMEAELLVRWFVVEPTLAGEWYEADDEALRSRFSPGPVRAALARAWLLPEGKQIADAWEYEVHSQSLHASPDRVAAAAKRPSGTLEDLEPLAVEIVSHGVRFLSATIQLYEKVGIAAVDVPTLSLVNAEAMLTEVSRAQAALGIIPTRIPRSRRERREGARTLKSMRADEEPGDART